MSDKDVLFLMFHCLRVHVVADLNVYTDGTCACIECLRCLRIYEFTMTLNTLDKSKELDGFDYTK